MKCAKAMILASAVFLLSLSPLSSIGQEACVAAVTPGDFSIDLGKYSNWNSEANYAHCNIVQFDCSIDSSDTTVGDTTSSSTSLIALNTLVTGSNGFAYECLDKAAALADKGQQAFVGVYDSDLGYQGVLMQHFQAEANECWNHYTDVVSNANLCLP
ncbi:MAG: hypothetical protein OXJ53_18610 [Gammaproteobacteria bacterium]|nr:hypothetical protein [Gammaproteobacteria bacterium]MDE0269899.1 hypothetical protein [Gammaproteobacteria bacterium]